MTNKLFLIIVLVCFRLSSFEQNITASEIYLHATTAGSDRFFIDIVSSNNNTKVTYKLIDSVRNFELEKDTNTIRWRQIIETQIGLPQISDTLRTFLNKLDSIKMTYTVYNTDSLIISNFKNENYYNLIKEVVDSPTEILENDDPQRIVLDGTMITFRLTNNDIARTVYANSPTLKSNPFLYKLITETTDLYRKNNSNDFLNKSKTCGY